MASKSPADKGLQERRQTLPENFKSHCTANQERKKEKEEDLIRAQYERLENEKQRIRQQKHEDFQRRLSQQSETTRKAVSQRRLSMPQPEEFTTSKSAHSKSPVDSKLFDYEKSQPRSRRQLQASDLGSDSARGGPSPGRSTDVSSRTSRHGSLIPAVSVTTPEAKLARSRTSGLDDRIEARAARSRTGERDDRKDLEARPAKSRTGETEKKVNFDENKLGVGQTGNSRFQRQRSKSIGDPTKVQLPDIQVEDSDESKDTQKLKELYNMAIEKVKSVDESLIAESSFVKGARAKSFSGASFVKGFDSETLKELEHILKDARVFSNRRSSLEDHTRPDVSSHRAQKKRIEHLEKVLNQLKPEDRHMEFDPQKVLQCSYLRLSKSNIQTLEEMCRDQGQDPGIHAHKDVTDYNIWEGLKEQRRDSLELPKR